MSKQQDINDNKRTYLELPWPRPGIIEINTGNTAAHEMTKALVVYLIKKSGTEALTEAKWSRPNGGKCDVFVPEHNYYVEILKSETDKMLKFKTEKYPKDVDQIVIKLTNEENEFVAKMAKRIKEMLP